MPAESRKEIRKRILSQATELFRERGYHSVTLDDIAKAVNHSKVTIYRYWESKEELLYEITKRSHLAVIDGLTKICRSDDLPEVKLRRAVENQVLQAMSNVGAPPFTGKLSQEVGLSPQHKQAIIKLRDKYDASLRQIIEEGMQQRRFIPCDARIVGFAITGAMNHIQNWYSPEGELSKEEIVDVISTFVMNGVLDRCSEETRSQG